MPAEFTLPDLQRVYEIVLDRPLEKSAFRTRILSADMIEPVARMRRGRNRAGAALSPEEGQGARVFRADVQSTGVMSR
ncbi:NrtR DNA-binding winged helix domain-containing protein [Bradyrhizobium stylosanthis]|uniref:NrtR DNA-binding winged helix domain-containing protein n=1 Tax=Bradyrhizobium stylosanthis TaxID=1803665 RepID=A0A560DWF8_9BRAD|nr:hypothetical protein [Bradyrhizobium stylosanthis]TWB01437.1 hypothetical protein FBZ96_103209 [Bradyrhizobium stylosanthis]